MKEIRRRGLSSGWYPSDQRSVERQCEQWRLKDGLRVGACAVMVPHAGWTYSGGLAFRGIGSLTADAGTVVVIGGHLGADAPVLIAPEQGFRTPTGNLMFDQDLAAFVRSQCLAEPDLDRENSVEIHLPIVKLLYPDSLAVWLRAPVSEAAIRLGETLAEWAREHPIVIVASTDLTHYGPRFGFVRPGSVENNHRWVSTHNDRGFLDACLSGDARAVLSHAARHRSACSAGAAAAAVSFANASGCSRSVELGYATSCDVGHDENLVGYATVGWYEAGGSGAR